MRTKAIVRLAFLGAAITWVVMVFSDLTILYSSLSDLPSDIPAWLPRIMIDLYTLALFYYYKFKVERDEGLNFTDLLWKVFASGLVVTVISLALRLVVFSLGSSNITTKPLFVYVIYQVNLSLLISFLLAAYTSWKRLIQYQKSKWLIRLWVLFEVLLAFVLFYDSIGIQLYEWVFTPLNIFLGLIILVLSGNMKWVAYLNFRQKWTSLLLLLLTFFYMAYFLFSITTQAETISQESSSFLDFRGNIFLLALMGFVVLYSIFSFLVIVFNLPTSSVFEQKLEEVVNFQRISQSIQTEQSEESVYKILLESSVSSVSADAAWLDIKISNLENRLHTYNIADKEAQAIREHLKSHNIRGVLDSNPDRTRNLSKHLSAIKGSGFRSLLAFPITVKGESIGTLALLKELPEGFNKEMTRIVSAFANQAGISIENFRLMEEALQNERYKEELKIAKMVQKSLLPQKLESDNDFDIAAFSESADEVGGDYYDTLRISESQVALIIADVSGKGTTAAFHMSQMKGIFHSLAQQETNPKEFMQRANRALTFCLERGSFISAAYFVIDTKTKSFLYSRAGHCPVLYYHAGKSQTEYLKDKGAALGMVKSHDFFKYIDSNEMKYSPGDLMVLYTDGITEAKNTKNEEYGYERLENTIASSVNKTPREIQELLIKALYEYTGTEEINDDYTTMIVKFR